MPADRVVHSLDRIVEWRGKPQQNAYIERYNRAVRGQWLAHNIFER